MEKVSANLLIVEDDVDIAEMLTTFFRAQNYTVQTVNWGEDGVRIAQNGAVDLVILDIRLPDIDGFEVAQRLRAYRKTQTIPIVFLTERRERSDRLRGLELQADDYITKPFDIQELQLRVNNALQRSHHHAATHPVTGLPSGPAVDEALAARAAGEKTWSVRVLHLDAFRDQYGFIAADDVLRAAALFLREEIGPQGFLGHLKAEEFIAVVPPERAAAFAARAQQRFEAAWPYFYPGENREGGLPPKSLAVEVTPFEA